MSQPLLGLVSSVAMMAAALGLISTFDFPAFAGPVAFFMLALIPMQIVVAVHWGASPGFAARLPQPTKGLVLILATVAAAMVVSPIALRLAGEGISPPGPIPSHYVIAVVPTTFWLAIMFGGWPFTALTKNTIVSGLLLLVAAYAVTFLVFRVFFNYDFLQGAPVYLASAPKGVFNGVSALVFYVTALAGMFLVLCFDLWPLTSSPALMKQPGLGVAWTVIAVLLAGIAFNLGMGGLGMDPMLFLTRVTAPFIFGTIIVLNMWQNSVFGSMAQPVKGLMNAVAAAAIGSALAYLYRTLAPAVTGVLPSGAPGYEQEIWLANSLLSVTFPFLIFHAAYFGFWPLAPRK